MRTGIKNLRLLIALFALMSASVMAKNAIDTSGTGEQQLKITSSVTNATCDILVPTSINFNGVSQRDFKRNENTASFKNIVVQLLNCKGQPSSTQRAKIMVTGHTLLGSNDTIFHNDTSVSSNSGFMLKSLVYDGSLSDFIQSPGTVKSGDYIIVNPNKGQKQDDVKLVYTIGYVSFSPGSTQAIAPEVGSTLATMTFKFLYQ